MSDLHPSLARVLSFDPRQSDTTAGIASDLKALRRNGLIEEDWDAERVKRELEGAERDYWVEQVPGGWIKIHPEERAKRASKQRTLILQ